MLRLGDDAPEVKPGSMIYVKAEVAHRFRHISEDEDLQVLDIFSKTEYDKEDKDWAAFEMGDVQSKRKADENVWNPFLDVTRLRCGVYMLLRKLGGDSRLRHKVDELNIVVNGTAKFRMGDDEINVRPGSMMWVKEGVGHSFHSLSDDFDVLILFEKRR